MDPLSNLFALLKPRSLNTGRFDLGAEQTVVVPSFEGIKCYAVLAGACWLKIEGSESALLTAGDCFLLPAGRPFQLAGRPGAPSVSIGDVLAAVHSGRSGLFHGDPVCTLGGGQFLLAGNADDMLLDLLPPLVHLSDRQSSAAMRFHLEQLREELSRGQLGSSFIIQQLAHILLMQALRAHLAEASRKAVGWLYAINDPQIKSAIQSMQDKPAKKWTLSELAQCVGMSRSNLALKFKERVGNSPMDYLTRWRMLIASDRLTSSDDSVLSIALSLGYDSESAFGKAFRRVIGSSPRKYSQMEKRMNQRHKPSTSARTVRTER